MQTIAEFIRCRAKDDHTALYFGEQRWTYRDYVQLCSQRAQYLLSARKSGPFHVGVLLDNVPEFAFWLGACAIAGATLVGLNSTRRGGELVRDIEHTDCQFVVCGSYAANELQEVWETARSAPRLLAIDTDDYHHSLAEHAVAVLPDVVVKPKDTYLLMLTSGTSGAPKACICSHGRFAGIASLVADAMQIHQHSISYVVMPWFHANAIYMGWLPALAKGAGVVMGKFSVSRFLDDVRHYGVTHFNYVGKPLAYLLSTPAAPDDADNTLCQVVGNEGNVDDIERFAKRFGCNVIDGYGSTEGGIFINRVSGMPHNALGVSFDQNVKIMNRETMQVCPRATFNHKGELLNGSEAIGEIVNLKTAGDFEGYYKNPEANQTRIYNGIVWSGDLGYQDEQGYFYFAGRNDDWVRVDGENIAAAQIEQLICRSPDILLASVYGVPDPVVGDAIMLSIQMLPGIEFDAQVFDRFLWSQNDFSPKWQPRFVRVAETLPQTPTAKILKRQLRQERWNTDDAVWRKPDRDSPYCVMSDSEKSALTDTVARRSGQIL